MRLDQLATIVCVGCGRKDDGTFATLPKSLWPNARMCERCAWRYAVEHLATEADQTLARATPARTAGRVCLHCGAGLSSPGVWCAGCEAERRRLIA